MSTEIAARSATLGGRRIPLGPSEGWLTVALVVLGSLAVAWAIDDAAWVLGRDSLTDFLAPVAVLAALTGFVLAKAVPMRWAAHLLSAIVAALVVPILVGAVLDPEATGIVEQFRRAAESTTQAYLDLAWRGRNVTREYGHFLWVLGLVVWITAYFAATAVFRHHRPGGAILALGTVLLVNMAITPRDQLVYVVLLSLVALFLLVRLHAFGEQSTWLRRRLGDPTPLATFYVRGGTLFVAAAVAAALFLTAVASSAPLASAWSGAESWLVDVGRGLQRYFSFVQSVRGPTSVVFGPTAPITGRWVTDSNTAMTIQVPPGDSRRYYWRATTYDRFEGTGWASSADVTVDIPSGQDVLAGTSEQTPAEGQATLTYRVTPVEYRGTTVVSPIAPLTVEADTRLTLLGIEGSFASLDTMDRGRPYLATAAVPALGDDAPQGLTRNRLRAAGTQYPVEIAIRYLALPDGSVGPEALALLDEVRASVEAARGDAATPYDLAWALEQQLRSPGFVYDTDVSDIDCGSMSTVECFATFRRGYCQYYASTMVVLLREAGIPARLVQGFLPGQRTADGTETIRWSDSHAWVEAYFPGYGWVAFDPTGGSVSRAEPIPEGQPVASAAPTPRASRSDDNELDPLRVNPPSSGGVTPGPGSVSGPLVLVAIALAAIVALFIAFAYRRTSRGPVQPEAVYPSIARMAARLGFRPRPSQTPYEFAAALGDALPSVRPEIQTVAHARVETVYGRRELDEGELQRLRDAIVRVRLALPRLLLRRRSRRS